MRYYFITGTSRGLGKAIAEELLQSEECFVKGIGRHQSIHHERYEHYSLDLSDIEACLEAEFDFLDLADKIVLINNAGTLGDIGYIGTVSDESLVNGLHTNLVAPIVLMNKFMATFRRNPCEKMIINVSSGAATKAYDGWGMYCTSKAGLKMISEVVAAEEELEAITYPFKILSIAPGVVRTKMQEHVRQSNKSNFSMIDKFMELDKSDALASPEAVAKKYVEIIRNPDMIKDVNHRITI